MVAQELLGKILLRRTPEGEMAGRIVETEAYFGPDDPASHAAKRKTPRNFIMFGKPGVAYIYLNYGIHFLLNVVTEREGVPGAVLIRAVEPILGEELMLKNRPVKSILQLTNGPGKLTQAMGIDFSFYGADLIEGDLAIMYPGDEGITAQDFTIVAAPRIGISVAQNELLRYYIKDNPFVSSKGRGTSDAQAGTSAPRVDRMGERRRFRASKR